MSQNKNKQTNTYKSVVTKNLPKRIENEDFILKNKSIEFSETKSKVLFDFIANLFNVKFDEEFDKDSEKDFDEDSDEESNEFTNKPRQLKSYSLDLIEIYQKYKLIKDAIDNIDAVTNEKLLKSLKNIDNIIKNHFKLQFQDLEFIKKNTMITYQKYKTILQRTKFILIKLSNGTCTAGIITYFKEIPKSNDNETAYFTMNYEYYIIHGNTYKKQSKYFYACDYDMDMNISNLRILPINHEQFIELHLRGKIHSKYVEGDGKSFHMEYFGNMLISAFFSEIEIPGTGRIMIDTQMHKQLFPSSYNSTNNQMYNRYDSEQFEILKKSFYFYCMLPATLPAFSFSQKIWADCYVEQIKEIEWDNNAYSKLVMDPSKKEILRTLILNSKNAFGDIVKNKSGGCIFLLHGTPGTGKTLTAETISETLHKPLYSITSGELGTCVSTMEFKLKEILDNMQKWDAVILIDEADVFLEKRDSQNLERNAIVCLFLRLLEKYHGIMFLTTNRKTNMDPAFQSRISLAFEYHDLNYENRFKVWNTLLESANIKLEYDYVNECSKYVINGRNIKNIIRLAHTLAIGQNSEPTSDHFDQIINLYMEEYDIKKEN